MRTALLFLSFVAIWPPDKQRPVLLRTWQPGHVVNVSVDQLGYFYFVLDGNRIEKRDPDGKRAHGIHCPKARLSLIESWSPLRLFIYDQSQGRYTVLNPSLDTLYSYKLPPLLSEHPTLVCPENNDRKIWAFDSVDRSLKKIDLQNPSVEIDVQLPMQWVNETSSIVFMREYQGRIFLLDRKTGVYVFNEIGIPVTHIEVEGLHFFNFIGEDMCYLKDGKAMLWNIYTGQQSIWQELAHPEGIRFIIATDERLVTVAEKTVNLYKITSG